jgi:hypothetical protein
MLWTSYPDPSPPESPAAAAPASFTSCLLLVRVVTNCYRSRSALNSHFLLLPLIISGVSSNELNLVRDIHALGICARYDIPFVCAWDRRCLLCCDCFHTEKKERERERERERVKAPTGRGWGGAHWHMGSAQKDLFTISAALVKASDSWLRPTLWTSGKITRDLFLCHGNSLAFTQLGTPNSEFGQTDFFDSQLQPTKSRLT